MKRKMVSLRPEDLIGVYLNGDRMAVFADDTAGAFAYADSLEASGEVGIIDFKNELTGKLFGARRIPSEVTKQTALTV